MKGWRTLVVVGLLVAFLPPVEAQTEPPSEFWVDASYAIDFSSLSNLTIDAHLSVLLATVEGKRYTADDIRGSFQGIPKYPGAQKIGDAYKASLTDAVEKAFKDGLANIFPDAPTRTVTSVLLLSDLAVANTAPAYDPPIEFQVKATVVDDRDKLGLGDLSDAAVNAAFAAGAKVRVDVGLAADPGFTNVFRLTPPAGLAYRPVSADAKQLDDGRSVEATVQNKDGTRALTDTFVVSVVDPSATAPTKEVVTSDVVVNIDSFTPAGGAIPLTIDVTSSVASLSIFDRLPGSLPPKVELDYLSADGVRALRNTGAISASEFEAAEAAMRSTVKSSVESAVGVAAAVTGDFDSASLSETPTKPYTAGEPLLFKARATASRTVEGLSGNNAQVAFDVGATIGLDVKLHADPAQSVSYTFRVPSGLAVDAPGKGVTVEDGRAVKLEVDNSAGATPKDESVRLLIHSANAPAYSAPDSKVTVTIDLADVDVSVTKAAGGDFGALVVNVGVDGAFGVLELPEEMKSKLPAGVDLKYLSSDGVRVLLEKGVIDQATVDELETRLVSEMESRLSEMLGQNVEVTGGLDDATLAAALVAEPLSGEKPIAFKAQASFRQSLSGAPTGGAAIALYTLPLSFNLPPLPGLETTYKFVLPKGFALAEPPTAPGATTTTGTEGGRDYFTVTPSGEQSVQTSFAVAITPGFVFAKFWPVILGVLLLLALVIATPIFLVVRARRKKNAAK